MRLTKRKPSEMRLKSSKRVRLDDVAMSLAKSYKRHEIPLAVHVPPLRGDYVLEVAHYNLGRKLHPKQLQIIDELVTRFPIERGQLVRTSVQLRYRLLIR